MKINISWSINVDGLWWDVQSEHGISDALSSADKFASVVRVIKGISSAGHAIPRTTKITEYDNGGNQTVQIDPGPAASSPTFTWPNPACTTHGTPMGESKTQKEKGHKMFYCPHRTGDGYCKQRAKVNYETGVPKLWEVA